MILIGEKGDGGSITLGFDGAIRVTLSANDKAKGISGYIAVTIPRAESVLLARAVLRAAGEKEEAER